MVLVVTNCLVVVTLIMGQFCCIPGFSKRSEHNKNDSFHRLPLHDKNLLKVGVHKIGRKNPSVNTFTHECSRHFVESKCRKLRPDEYPTLNLLILLIQVTQPHRKDNQRRGLIVLQQMMTVTNALVSPRVEEGSQFRGLN